MFKLLNTSFISLGKCSDEIQLFLLSHFIDLKLDIIKLNYALIFLKINYFI